MTKEEALKILKDCRRRGFDRTTYYIDEYHTARDMAIRALEEQETVTEFADRCRECGARYGRKLRSLDKTREEIEKQEKWLLQAGYSAYNVDIAFDAIKHVIAESEG